MIKVRLTSVTPAGQQFLMFTETVFDETTGIATSTKMAFTEVQPEKAETALEYAENVQWEFGEETNRAGVYNIVNTGVLVHS